jgi:hypothetical protein
MVDRDVGCTLLEVANGVTADLHEIRHEPIRFDDRALRVIHEPGLVGTPRLGESRPMLGAQWLDVKLLHALHAFAQLLFGVSSVTALAHQPFVFGSELAAQLFASALLHQDEGDDDDRQRHQHTNDYSGVE